MGALVASAADVERAREEGVKVRADVVKGLVRSLVEKIHSFLFVCLTKLMFIVDPLLFFSSIVGVVDNCSQCRWNWPVR